MSLINDALKKAERERGQRQDSSMFELPAATATPPRRSRGRRYLRGFIISLLVVGTVTTLTTSYLVNQLLEPSGAKSGFSGPPLPSEPSAGEAQSAANAGPVETPSGKNAQDVASSPMETISRAKAVIDEAQSVVQEASKSVPESRAQTNQIPTAPPPGPAASASGGDLPASEAAAVGTVTAGVAPSAPKTADSSPPEPVDPATATRAFSESLSGLEVRGLMQASGRVLIFDAATGKTRTYSVGDSLEGRPDCRILAIEGASVRMGGPQSVQHTLHF